LIKFSAVIKSLKLFCKYSDNLLQSLELLFKIVVDDGNDILLNIRPIQILIAMFEQFLTVTSKDYLN